MKILTITLIAINMAVAIVGIAIEFHGAWICSLLGWFSALIFSLGYYHLKNK